MSLPALSLRVLRVAACGLPEAWMACAVDRLADAHRLRSPGDRQAVEANLSLALGRAVPADSPLVRDVFRNFGRYLLEFFTAHRLEGPLLTVEGSRSLDPFRQGRRGAIIMTAHLGNWELGAMFLRRMGLPLAAIALPHRDPAMDRLFNDQRQRCGLEIIALGRDAAQRSLQRLRSGECIGVLGDREFGHQGLDVQFFGHRTTFPRGPAVLSLRSRAPVVPTFLIREGSRRFVLSVEPPVWPNGSAVTEEAVRQLTQGYAGIVERYVKRHLDQWLLFEPAAAG